MLHVMMPNQSNILHTACKSRLLSVIWSIESPPYVSNTVHIVEVLKSAGLQLPM